MQIVNNVIDKMILLLLFKSVRINMRICCQNALIFIEQSILTFNLCEDLIVINSFKNENFETINVVLQM